MNRKATQLLAALLAALCLFAAQGIAEDSEPAPAVDPTQAIYTDEPIATATPSPGQDKPAPYFSFYSIGDAYTAASGDGTAACDVRNKPASTHDIYMRWFITEDELAAHGLPTEGLEYANDSEVGRWPVVKTGLFEPGYHITEVQLLPLRDGTYLPAGVYNLILSETYYDHETGEVFPYETMIPITLTVQG